MIAHEYNYTHSFALENGGTLSSLQVRFHLSTAAEQCYLRHQGPGQLPVIWICHALTANSDPQQWWDTLVGPGKLFDTDHYYIVCANMLASCYGSTSPLSINPESGEPYGFDFPVVTIRDMVAAHELLRAHLGIEHIDMITGGSSGGFQALEWSITHPQRIRQLFLIGTAARVSPWATALNQTQRLALEADETFRSMPDGGKKGLAAARAMALISYRSYEGYRKTQSEASPDCLLATRACSYQDYQGKKLTDRFHAQSYYYLTLSLDSHNVGRGRGGVTAALQRITARTLCLAIDSDLLFPVEELRRIADDVRDAHFEIITSDYGHDGFLLEYKQISEKICKYLSLEEVR